MKWKLSVKDIFNASPVLPVMVINQIEDAEAMAQALLEGGGFAYLRLRFVLM